MAHWYGSWREQVSNVEELMTVDVDNMMDHEYDLYGAHTNKFMLDKVIFEAVEDPGDGYRSYFGCLMLPVDADASGFFKAPIARVVLKNANVGEFMGWRLIDVTDGHTWLEFGTDHSDSYYPCFVFDYSPKKLNNETEQHQV